MANLRIEDILDSCIDEMRSGRVTLETCLRQYPSLQAELEPLLRVALQITPLDVQPDTAHKLAARARFIEALYEADRPNVPRPWLNGLLGRPIAMGLVGAFALATTGAAYAAAEQSLPGDPFYGLKVTIEEARVAAAPTDEAKLEARLDVAARRLAEVQMAVDSQRPEAAVAAAEGYAHAASEAQDRLQRVAPQANAATLAKAEQELRRHEEALALAADRAPAKARDALQEARKEAAGPAQKAVARVRPTDAPAITREVPIQSPARPTQAATATPVSAPQIVADLSALEQQVQQQVDTQAPEFRKAEEGLRAKLEAARAALSRGQPQAARNQLDAFRNELDAFRRSGRISEETYRQLATAEASLSASIAASGRTRREPVGAGNAPRPSATTEPRRPSENQNVSSGAPARPGSTPTGNTRGPSPSTPVQPTATKTAPTR